MRPRTLPSLSPAPPPFLPALARPLRCLGGHRAAAGHQFHQPRQLQPGRGAAAAGGGARGGGGPECCVHPLVGAPCCAGTSPAGSKGRLGRAGRAVPAGAAAAPPCLGGLPCPALLLPLFERRGPNWKWRPSKAIQRLAHDLVDAGADVILGTRWGPGSGGLRVQWLCVVPAHVPMRAAQWLPRHAAAHAVLPMLLQRTPHPGHRSVQRGAHHLQRRWGVRPREGALPGGGGAGGLAAHAGRMRAWAGWLHAHPNSPTPRLRHLPACPATAGAFVDDYRLDEGYRNDLSFLFCCHIADGRPAWLELVPTRIVHKWQVRRCAGCAGCAGCTGRRARAHAWACSCTSAHEPLRARGPPCSSTPTFVPPTHTQCQCSAQARDRRTCLKCT